MRWLESSSFLSALHMPMCLVSVSVEAPGEEGASQQLQFDPQPRAKGRESGAGTGGGVRAPYDRLLEPDPMPTWILSVSPIKGTFRLFFFFEHPLIFFFNLFKETGSYPSD